MKHIVRIPFFAVVSLMFASCANLPEGAVSPQNLSEGVAIKGYDPVAYFHQGKPVEGSPEIDATWEGAVYHFATEENREVFINSPEKYVPQYGGYCAYAIAVDQIADIDPDYWAIVDERLYLNANGFAQTLWDLDRPANIESGNANWNDRFSSN
ncbi:MAG: YHS domain-containing (seleno)protein [Verrucomicrobiota bacterium]